MGVNEIEILALRTHGYSVVNYKYSLKCLVLVCENPLGWCKP